MLRLVLLLALPLLPALQAVGQQPLVPVKQDGNYGYINARGRLKVKPRYETGRPFRSERAWVKRKDAWWLINEKGKVLAKTAYDQVQDFEGAVAKVKSLGSWGLVDRSGEEVQPPVYDEIGPLFHGHFLAILDGRMGLLDHRGNEVIPFRYDQLHPPFDGYVAFRQYNNRWGFLGLDGRRQIPPRFQRVRKFNNGLAWVMTGGKWGLINKAGEFTVEPRFDRVYYGFHQGLSDVRTGLREGLVNRQGEAVLPIKYDAVGRFSEGLCWVKAGGRVGFVNRSGLTEISFRYDQAGGFHEGRARVGRNGRFGFIDSSGRVAVPLVYDDVGRFRGGLAKVKTAEGWGIVNRQGQVMVPARYKAIPQLAHGWVVVLGPQGYGLYDSTGRQRLRPEYTRIELLNHEGLIRVKAGSGLMGFLNTEGETALPLQWQDVGQFRNGLAPARKDSLWGAIDRRGKWQIEPAYAELTGFADGRAWGQLPGQAASPAGLTGLQSSRPHQWVLLDTSGRRPGVPSFEQALSFQDGLARVKTNGRWGVVDSLGRFILEPQNLWISPLKAGRYYIVLQEGGFGVIDRRGGIRIPARHDFLFHVGNGVFEAGLYRVDMWGNPHSISDLRNARNEVIYDKPVQLIQPFRQGAARIESASGWGVMDTSGEFILKPAYEAIGPYDGRYYPVKTPRGWGLMDRTANWVFQPFHQTIRGYADGMAAFQADGTWGFLDAYGVVAIEPRFEAVKNFHHGAAPARKDGKWGLIGREGHWLTEPAYDDLEAWGKGLFRSHRLSHAYAETRPEAARPQRITLRTYGLIDAAGNELVEPSFPELRRFANQRAAVRSGLVHAKIGYLNFAGKWLWKPQR